MFKQIIKHGVQKFAASFGPQTRRHTEPQLLILMYHRILPADDERIADEEPGMAVSPETFEFNLDILSQYFEFIALSDWLKRKNLGQLLPNMACTITFDDGWKDNYEFAFPILQKKGIPATVFVVSDMIGTTRLFWPERLAKIARLISTQYPEFWTEPEMAWLRTAKTDFRFSNASPTREQLSQLIAHAKQNSDQENHDRLDVIEQNLILTTPSQMASLLSWEQLSEMNSSGLIEIGSHTCNHTRVNKDTPLLVAKNEIINSKKTIESHIETSVQTFCFPNGNYTDDALSIVKNNYIGAVTTQKGWNMRNSDNYLLRRIGVHEDIAKNETTFLACVSGWI